MNEVQKPGQQPIQIPAEDSETEADEPVVEDKPKKRGRKLKAKSSDESNSEVEIKQSKRRGRKPKQQVDLSEESDF